MTSAPPRPQPVADPTAEAEGLFGPHSVSWRVDRELLVLAGGSCALLMQAAHPSVAAGVVQHSTFATDPFGRLMRTLESSFAVVFGSRSEAESALRRVNAIHAVVRGRRADGVPYTALDPEALLWVHATLVDTALRMHDRFVAPLDAAELDTYHLEAAEVAVRLGVPEAMLPPTLAGLRAWMDGLITSGEVRVGPSARGLLPSILYPTRFPPRFVWDAAHLASVSILEPRIRRQYGLVWNRRRARGVMGLAAVSRRVVSVLPPAVRHVPPARVPRLS